MSGFWDRYEYTVLYEYINKIKLNIDIPMHLLQPWQARFVCRDLARCMRWGGTIIGMVCDRINVARLVGITRTKAGGNLSSSQGHIHQLYQNIKFKKHTFLPEFACLGAWSPPSPNLHTWQQAGQTHTHTHTHTNIFTRSRENHGKYQQRDRVIRWTLDNATPTPLPHWAGAPTIRV